MYQKLYLRRRILMEQNLVEIYARKGVKANGKNYVYATYAEDWIGVSEKTFSDHTNTEKYDYPGEETPLYVEAMLRSIERNRAMARKYEQGRIRLSEIPEPLYIDLIEAIKARRERKAKTETETEEE